MVINKYIVNKKTLYFLLYLYSNINKFIYGYLIKVKQVYLYLNALNLLLVLRFLKSNSISGFNSLLDITAVDKPSRGFNRYELNYVFLNYTFEYRFGLKIFVDGVFPVFSISGLYKSSDWLEREVWDMYGIKFLFHCSLRRILTDYGFKGHPLKKDFPLVGFIDVFYDDSRQAINIAPVEISQALRFFQFESPWNKWCN